MILLTSQKDEIYDIIEINDFSPSQFEIYLSQSLNPTKYSDKGTIISLKKSEFSFRLEGTDHNIFTLFTILCPGEKSFKQTKSASSWIQQKSFFTQWLGFLKRELTTPNKWERLQNEMNQINASYDESVDKFSAQEYEELKHKMNQLKLGIKSIGLLPEQITIINAKIDHLTELALTMNKFDWKGLFIGTIVNLSMALSFSNEARTAFWGLIKIVLSPIILLP